MLNHSYVDVKNFFSLIADIILRQTESSQTTQILFPPYPLPPPTSNEQENYSNENHELRCQWQTCWMVVPRSSAAISSLGFPGLDHRLGCPFAVSGQPQPTHEVNEPSGWVEI